MIHICKPEKVSIFDNRALKLPIAKVKALTGADIVFNGGLFEMATYQPYCDIKINGEVKNNDEYGYYGYGWNNGELPKVMHSNDIASVENYISCVWAIHNGEKVKMIYPTAMGGARGRTAFGFKSDGSVVIICTNDKAPITMEQTQDKLFANGCVSGIILDGGGSSQCITPLETVSASRIVSNFICVYLPKTKEDDTTNTLNIIQPNYKWAYGATLRKKTTHIVLHHVGVVGSFTPEQIHAEHLRKGWRGIAYNYYIRKDGTIYHGREENAAGGHTLNYNLVSIGVCFEGNFEVEKMPLAQQEAGQALIADILTRYPTAKVVRHKDLNATACPGKNFPFTAIITPPTPITKTIYRVQLGSFTAKTGAQALVNELKSKGYTAIITEGKL